MIKKLISFTALAGLALAAFSPFSLGGETGDSAPLAETVSPDEAEAAPAPSPAAEEQSSLAERSADGEIIWISDWSRGKKGQVPEGWKLDGKIKPIVVELSGRGEDSVLRLRSRDSSFGVYREGKIDIREYPFLNWEWKVTELPEGGSFLDKHTDDQAAQVYVSFGSLSFFNKPFVKAVGYYWSSTVPVGTEGECPTWSKSRAIVLRSGKEELGQWQREKRNVAEDYRRLFGDDAPSAASALRLYTNSQHTGTGTEVFFRDIYFSRE